MKSRMSSIIRGGRLPATENSVVGFISSLEDDFHIYQPTVLINAAHVIALQRARAIDRQDARKILAALRKIEKKAPRGGGVEDIHVLIEEYVTKRVGPDVGGRMHLAKSRNDQVATAIRMTLRIKILQTTQLLLSLQSQIISLARKHERTVFPGYTHLQPAQPITFAHFLLAHHDSLDRSTQRLLEIYQRVNMSPMGAGAIAGTSFSVNRNLVARLLGFDAIVENSLDGIGTRDFALEALGVFSIVSLDLSRLAQDLIFYSSGDVGLVELPDEFSSTSSIMPQKKNPDPLEVLRARCAKIAGNHLTATIMLHGLPSGYNLDFQEVTPLLWESTGTLKSCLTLMAKLVPRIKVSKSVAGKPYMPFLAATEIANILVRSEDLPFRKAHHIMGTAVRIAMKRQKDLREFTPKDWNDVTRRKLNPRTLREISAALDPQRLLHLYRSKGSPNPKETRKMANRRATRLKLWNRRVDSYVARLRMSDRELHAAARSV